MRNLIVCPLKHMYPPAPFNEPYIKIISSRCFLSLEMTVNRNSCKKMSVFLFICKSVCPDLSVSDCFVYFSSCSLSVRVFSICLTLCFSMLDLYVSLFSQSAQSVSPCPCMNSPFFKKSKPSSF